MFFKLALTLCAADGQAFEASLEFVFRWPVLC